MTRSTHQIAVKGVDQTAGAFASIQNRARLTSSQISAVMGGAIAAAGAYLSVRSFADATKELGKLSDLAMKSGASVEFLTKSAAAFQVAGLNISVDSLAKSMQYLEKATGKTGEGAFWGAIDALRKIEDPAKRGAEAVRIFGRGALEMQPLINAGEETADKFRKLQSLMPGVSTSAAQAGDEVADAMTTLGKGVKSIFLRAVGKIIGLWAKDFPGGVRAGALNAYNWLETFFKKCEARINKWGANIASSFAWWGDLFTKGYDAANDIFNRTNTMAETEYTARMAQIEKQREDYLKTLKTMSVDDLSNALGKGRGGVRLGEEVGEAAAKAAKKISNNLIMGGSNAARRLSVLGPEYQNEQKKQTRLLEKIAANTGATAENTDAGGEYPATDVGA